MEGVYIKAEDLNKWIVRHLPGNKDFYSIEDLLGAIEDMDGTIENLQEELTRLKEYLGTDDEFAKREYYDEERAMERYYEEKENQ